MKILAEENSLIESYSALVSDTLGRTLQRERQELRDIEAKVLLALEKSLNVEMGNIYRISDWRVHV